MLFLQPIVTLKLINAEFISVSGMIKPGKLTAFMGARQGRQIPFLRVKPEKNKLQQMFIDIHLLAERENPP